MSELIAMTATEVVGLLRRGDVSSLELLDAFEHHIEAVDRAVGALPTLDRARDHAKGLEAQPVEDRGLLSGLPVPITPGRWPCPTSRTGG